MTLVGSFKGLTYEIIYEEVKIKTQTICSQTSKTLV